jgi:hypothetical protein
MSATAQSVSKEMIFILPPRLGQTRGSTSETFRIISLKPSERMGWRKPSCFSKRLSYFIRKRSK